MCTNEDIITWTPLVIKISKRYERDFKKFGYELEDIKQVAYIGLIKGLEGFKEGKGTTIKTYLYNCCRWQIQREIHNLTRAKRFVNNNTSNISLDSYINDKKELTLEEIIQDSSVNLEAKVLEEIVIREYIEEIEDKLEKTDSEIIMLKIFDGYSYREIANKLNLDYKKTSNYYNSARKKLINRSLFIRRQYEKYLKGNIKSFQNPLKAVVDNEYLEGWETEKVKKRIRAELINKYKLA